MHRKGMNTEDIVVLVPDVDDLVIEFVVFLVFYRKLLIPGGGGGCLRSSKD